MSSFDRECEIKTTDRWAADADADPTWTDAQGKTLSYRPATLRPCDLCHKSFEWDGTAYKTVCINCYREKARSCAKCHVGTIRPTAPKSHSVCATCFVDNLRAKGYSVCPTCPPDKKTHLRRGPGRTMCTECETRLKS